MVGWSQFECYHCFSFILFGMILIPLSYAQTSKISNAVGMKNFTVCRCEWILQLDCFTFWGVLFRRNFCWGRSHLEDYSTQFFHILLYGLWGHLFTGKKYIIFGLFLKEYIKIWIFQERIKVVDNSFNQVISIKIFLKNNKNINPLWQVLKLFSP